LSGRGLCDELITRPEESYWLWCVVCDLETSRIGAPYIYDISNLRVNHWMDIVLSEGVCILLKVHFYASSPPPPFMGAFWCCLVFLLPVFCKLTIITETLLYMHQVLLYVSWWCKSSFFDVWVIVLCDFHFVHKQSKKTFFLDCLT